MPMWQSRIRAVRRHLEVEDRVRLGIDLVIGVPRGMSQSRNEDAVVVLAEFQLLADHIIPSEGSRAARIF